MTPEMERAKRNQENISSVGSVPPRNENMLKSNIAIPEILTQMNGAGVDITASSGSVMQPC